ncbi:hypothetical protein GUJ93_ZPchr0002g25152 [Zizania palustris]|uniref:Uncharacterized protein n=1 Tax=Zizania palustris TaxID=103762 RepID=A0A8J5RX63_ZIZPA|nr:hypothetical protein GUJ93_ZPchr0002g25152 [Zizania palustris]
MANVKISLTPIEPRQGVAGAVKLWKLEFVSCRHCFPALIITFDISGLSRNLVPALPAARQGDRRGRPCPRCRFGRNFHAHQPSCAPACS